MRDLSFEYHCLPRIYKKDGQNGFEMKEISTSCKNRLSFEGYKSLITSQMRQLMPDISNMYNMTFNEPLTKEFIRQGD